MACVLRRSARVRCDSMRESDRFSCGHAISLYMKMASTPLLYHMGGPFQSRTIVNEACRHGFWKKGGNPRICGIEVQK